MLLDVEHCDFGLEVSTVINSVGNSSSLSTVILPKGYPIDIFSLLKRNKTLTDLSVVVDDQDCFEDDKKRYRIDSAACKPRLNNFR